MNTGALIGWAVTAGVVALGWNLIACALWPFAACRRCGGNGKRWSPSGRNHGRCRRCKGTGERIRAGRRLWTWLVARKHDAVG